MSRVPFATFVFRGKRFDEAAMPLEALVELEAYRELVLAVAEALFRQQNPDRVRLPKGFGESLRLVLASQEPGSTVPNVDRVLPSGPATLPGIETGPDLFDQAAQIVREAFEAAARESLPESVAADLVGRMLAFGKTLREDESVVIAAPGARVGPVVDRRVRRWLQQRVGGPYEEPVELVGQVRAADRDREGFHVRTLDGSRVPVSSAGPLFDRALASLAEESVVRVRGTGIYDAGGALLKVINVGDVSLAEEGDEGESSRVGCSIPIAAQLERLKGLEAGWLDGEGEALDAAALDRAGAVLTAMVEDGASIPYLYPKPDRDLQAEWSLPGREISLAFDLSTWRVEAIAASLDSDEVEEESLDLSQPGAELRLGRLVHRWLRGER